MQFTFRKIILTSLSLLVLPACGAAQNEPSGESVDDQSSELVKAIPQPDWVAFQMTAADPSVPVNPEQVTQTPTSCQSNQPAMFAALTHQVTSDANRLAENVFGVVAQITSNPPSAMAPGHAIWAPLVDPQIGVVYKLEVNAIAPHTFQFALSGKPIAATDPTMLTVLGGVTTMFDPAHRESHMNVDFGAMHALNPANDPVSGGAAIDYQIAEGARSVGMTLQGISGPKAPVPNDAIYRFHNEADGSGAFEFVTRTDFDHDGTLDELLHVQSRWAGIGAGQAAVAVTGGSLGTASVHATECWNPLGAVVFYADDINANPPAGDPSCCPLPLGP